MSLLKSNLLHLALNRGLVKRIPSLSTVMSNPDVAVNCILLVLKLLGLDGMTLIHCEPERFVVGEYIIEIKESNF